MTDKMIARKEGPIGHLIFNNPEKRNAMSQDMSAAIPGIMDDFEADPAVRVIVVSGAGGRAFVSGGDIAQFDRLRASAAANEVYSRVGDTARARLKGSPKPVIAMIRGYCLGGGMSVAMACDFRIAAEGSQFGIPAAKLGNGYSESSLRPLVALVGPAAAKHILFTGRRYEAAEALRIGLIDRVVPEADLEDEVRRLAEEIAANAPLTIAAAKATINALAGGEVPEEMAAAKAAVDRCFDSVDFKEGRTAFAEKRKPVFIGR